MTTLTVSPSLRLEVYESIKELPAALYQKARQYEVMTAELGSTADEQEQMLRRAEGYAMAGQVASFQEQMHNYRLARVLTRDGFQPVQLDWACRVHSINGLFVTDYSEDALLRLIDDCSAGGLTQQLLETALDDVKKKWLPN